MYGSTEVDTEAGQLVEVEISTSTRSGNLRQDVRQALVLESKILTAPGEPIKRHLEIQLPTDQEYRAGDYLAVLPINPRGSVSRVMKRFQLPWDSAITIKSSGPTILPTNRQLSAYDVISAYVEVGQPATRKVSSWHDCISFSSSAAATDENIHSIFLVCWVSNFS